MNTPTTLSAWQIGVDVAQILTAIVTTLGIIISFKFAQKAYLFTLQQSTEAQKPYLILRYEIAKLPLSKNDVSKFKSERIIPAKMAGFGHLQNIGSGPAMGIDVGWLYGDVTNQDGEKTTRWLVGDIPAFHNDLVGDVFTSSMSTHLLAGESTSLTRLPKELLMLIDQGLRCEGSLVIGYKDRLGNSLSVVQEFKLHAGDLNSMPVRLTIGSEILMV